VHYFTEFINILIEQDTLFTQSKLNLGLLKMISEEIADNRHFVAELTEGKSTRREVEISFFVWNINEIDIVNQRFSVRFNMYASWVEDTKNIQVPEGSARFEEFMFWNPQLRFTNLFESDSDEHEAWYRVFGHDSTSSAGIKASEMNSYEGDRVRIMYCQRLQGVFHEGFELHNFPFDLQHLHIGVTTSWDHDAVAISFDNKKLTRVSSAALTSQTWNLACPRLMSYKDDWDEKSLPLLSQSTDSATGVRYCRAYLALTITRRPNFIMWNVMVIMTLVGFFSFATYALEPEELGDRQAVVLTLVLTTVAYKYVTTSMMPEISYVTMMDVVIYSCMFLQAFMMLGICISANIYDPNRTFDFMSAGFLFIGWFAILIWFAIRSIYLSKSRSKYIYRCDRKLGELQCGVGEKVAGKFYNSAAAPPM